MNSYRQRIAVWQTPLAQLSVIDINPASVERTLVLLHGFGGQATDWRASICNFGDAYRIIAPDLRGHGKSDKRLAFPAFEREYGDWSRARHNRDAAAPMDATTMHYYDIGERNRWSPRARRTEILYTLDLILKKL
jgi:pimeloyl-ACP methyl ester carboxylesterase